MLWSKSRRRRPVSAFASVENLESRALLSATGLDLEEATPEAAEVVALSSETSKGRAEGDGQLTGTWSAAMLQLSTIQKGTKVTGRALISSGLPMLASMKIKGTIDADGDLNLRFSTKMRYFIYAGKMRFTVTGNFDAAENEITGVVGYSLKRVMYQEYPFTAELTPTGGGASSLPGRSSAVPLTAATSPDLDDLFLQPAALNAPRAKTPGLLTGDWEIETPAGELLVHSVHKGRKVKGSIELPTMETPAGDLSLPEIQFKGKFNKEGVLNGKFASKVNLPVLGNQKLTGTFSAAIDIQSQTVSGHISAYLGGTSVLDTDYTADLPAL